MTLPVISLRQANRYLLRRQHVLQPCTDPVAAVRDACGLQAQVPSAPALSLRARVEGFQPRDYELIMAQERSLVRTWAMRGTVHVVPSALLPRYTRVYTRRYWTEEQIRLAAGLLTSGPKTRSELSLRAVSELGLTPEQAREMFGPWGGILRDMARSALTVHTPNEGPDVRLALTADWLDAAPEAADVETLEDALLADYLHGYGPVSVYDFAHFTAFPSARVRAIWARAHDLAELRLEGSKRAYFLHAADLPALLATTGQEPAPVRLLPRFDSLLLAHREKARILDEQWRRSVFKPAAVVDATVLIDGMVAGTWTVKQTARTLRFYFQPFGHQEADAVEAEARRLADWYALDRLAFEVKPARLPAS